MDASANSLSVKTCSTASRKMLTEKKIGETIIKFFWLFIVLPKEALLLFSCAFIVYYLVFSRKRLSKIATLLVVMGLLQLFSTIVFVIANEFDVERFFAAINTGVIWIIFGLLFDIFRSVCAKKVRKYARINLIILFGFSVFSLLLSRVNISIFFPLSEHSLWIWYWRGGSRHLRLVAFMEYPNLIIFFCMVMLYLAIDKNKLKPMDFMIVAMTLLPIFLSMSRIGIFVIGVFYLAMFFNWFTAARGYFFQRAVLVVLFTLIVGLVLLFFNQIYGFFTNILEGSPGSNALRAQIYLTSISTVMSNSPIIGMGIKTQFYSAFLGSHSTYISILFRTGIVGALIFLLFQGKILSNAIMSRNLVYLAYVILLFLFIALEDIDGTNWLAILFLPMALEEKTSVKKVTNISNIMIQNDFAPQKF